MTANEWGAYYDDREALFNRLSDMAAVLLRQQLASEGIKFLSVTCRVKDKSSFIEKIDRKGYDDPADQITDFAAIRVVTYLPSQVERICTVIESFFEIDKANSSNKTDDLGLDKVGYQSRHFVCSLGKRRAKLPEYQLLHDLKFEIQVRTILQHAWADLAHGKSYKFSARLPPELQRRLNLHAGNLELVDIGLDELSKSIDDYAVAISTGDNALFPEPVNAISLQSYVKDRFPDARLTPISALDALVDEVRAFGIQTIGQLDDILNKDLEREIETSPIKYSTDLGLVRVILIANDPDRYFSIWESAWSGLSKDMYELLCSRLGKERVHALAETHGFDASVEID